MGNEKQGSGDRIILIDALRGFALLGILITHFNHWYVMGPLPPGVVGKYQDSLTQITGFVTATFISNKFYMLFSYIFGLSFYLQTRSFSRYGGNINVYFLRRALFLFLIGVVHYSLWLGDILAVYGLLMVPLLFIHRFNDRWMALTAFLLIFNVPGISIITLQALRAHAPIVPAVAGAVNPLATELYRVVTSGGIADFVRYDLHFLHTRIQFQIYSGSLFMILGFFTLGMMTIKHGWLKRVGELRGRFIWLIPACGLLLIGFHLAAIRLAPEGADVAVAAKVIVFFLGSIGGLVSVLMNICVVAALMYNPVTLRFTEWMADMGRMALTNYLLQTCVGIFLFYYVGAGVFDHTSPGMNFIIAFGVFGIQLVFSQLWFRFFNYGFVEWLLRAGTLWHFKDLVKTRES